MLAGRSVCAPHHSPALGAKSLPFNHFLLAFPHARVARCLASLFNPDIYPQTGCFVKLSQEGIGHLSALSRRRANRALHELAKAGLLRIEFGGVTVLDLPGLRSHTGTL